MIKIRPGELCDCSAIAHIQVDSYRVFYAHLFPPGHFMRMTYSEQEQDWANMLSSDFSDILLVAETEDARVVGYLLASSSPYPHPGYDAEIIAMHVRRSCQHQGIGTALWLTALRDLHERGCRSVMLWTLRENPVGKWYEKLGGVLMAGKEYQVENRQIAEIAYGWRDMTPLLEIIPKKPSEKG